jgi:hypothetical protein
MVFFWSGMRRSTRCRCTMWPLSLRPTFCAIKTLLCSPLSRLLLSSTPASSHCASCSVFHFCFFFFFSCVSRLEYQNYLFGGGPFPVKSEFPPRPYACAHHGFVPANLGDLPLTEGKRKRKEKRQQKKE